MEEYSVIVLLEIATDADLCPSCMTKAIKNKDRCHWCGTLFIKPTENNNESN